MAAYLRTVLEGQSGYWNFRTAGQGAWQSATILCGWELIGKYLGIFIDRVEVGLDQKVMDLLEAGRRRAAGLAEDEEEEPQDGSCAEPKPKLN